MIYILKVDDAALVEPQLPGIQKHDQEARIICSPTLGKILITKSKDGATIAKMFRCSDHPESQQVVQQAKNSTLPIGELIARGLI